MEQKPQTTKPLIAGVLAMVVVVATVAFFNIREDRLRKERAKAYNDLVEMIDDYAEAKP